MIIWKAAIPEMIVYSLFSGRTESFSYHAFYVPIRETLYPRALPDRLSAVDVVADQPQVRPLRMSNQPS